MNSITSMLKEFCRKHGGKFKKEGEFDTCRIPITSESYAQKRSKVYEIFRGIEDFAEREMGVSGFSKIAEEISLHRGNVSGTIKVDPNVITAIEISVKPADRVLHITPITKRGRGCTLFFGKYVLGGYCDKFGTDIDVESFSLP